MINKQLHRRQALAILGGAGMTAVLHNGGEGLARAAESCVELSPAMTEGPYWVDEMLNRSDIRVDPTDGSIQSGVVLALAIKVQEENGSCAPLAGAQVDIWHCDAMGDYSDESANRTVGKKYLRGYQVTDDTGTVQFTTVYPGWYRGRAVHIHVRVRTISGTTVYDNFTTQLFFDDSVTDGVHAVSPYSTHGTRDTRNNRDSVYTGAGSPSQMLLALTGSTDAGYTGSIEIGVDLKAATIAAPTVASAGVVSAGSYAAGVTPSGWVSIFGTNLAASTKAVSSSDLKNGFLPTTFAGVSVLIGGKSAFVNYVSPSQLNVQVPAGIGAGAVPLTVTNASGTSSPVTVVAETSMPAFFVISGYVAAVRSDGVIVTGTSSTAAGITAAVKPGDILALYGTGFGPTQAEVPAGEVFQGSFPLADPVSVSIGGMAAAVSYAGLVAAGLHQLNVTVPSLTSGDYEVIAQTDASSTQSGVLLKVAT